jgi:hypothetical protein
VGGTRDNGWMGATWIWTRSLSTWTEQAKLVGTGGSPPSFQGYSVSLSSDGNTCASGAAYDNSQFGATWVFFRYSGVWSQQAGPLIGSGGIGAIQYQGSCVSLTSNGSLLCIGAEYDNNLTGAFYIFERNSSNIWSQLGSKVVGEGTGTGFGMFVSFNGDGSYLAVGINNSNPNLGIAYVYQNVSNVYQFYQNITPNDSQNYTTTNFASTVCFDSLGKNIVLGTPENNNGNGSTQIFTKCY